MPRACLHFDSLEAAQAWVNRNQTDKASKRPVRRLVASEEEEHKALVARAKLYEYRYPALKLFCHVKNEGTTWSWAERHKALAMGIKPGMTDFVLFWPARNFHAWCGELKALDGKPTNDQKTVVAELKKRGYFADFFYGQDEAWKSLMWYLDGTVW